MYPMLEGVLWCLCHGLVRRSELARDNFGLSGVSLSRRKAWWMVELASTSGEAGRLSLVGPQPPNCVCHVPFSVGLCYGCAVSLGCLWYVGRPYNIYAAEMIMQVCFHWFPK
jgi:hypothetical protein